MYCIEAVCRVNKKLFPRRPCLRKVIRPAAVGIVTSFTKSNKEGKDQESIHNQASTPDPGYQWESDKFTIRHHKREPRGPSSDHKASINRGAQTHNKYKTEIT